MITGATGGIGQELVRVLTSEGNQVVAVGNQDTAVSFAESVAFVQCDLSNQQGIERFISSVTDFEIDAFVHCAGLAHVARLGQIESEKLREMFFVNVISAIQIINLYFPRMLAKGFGRIVLVGSVVGNVGGIGLSGYSSTKSALSALNKSINREIQVAKSKFPNADITTNLVKPGYVDTNMTINMAEQYKEAIIKNSTLKRFLKSEEIALEISRFIQPSSRVISGSEIDINGGQTF